MNIIFPIIELIDRYSIACIKFKKTNGLNKDELEFYKKQIDNISVEWIKNEIQELMSIHEKIWMLESELKSGHENMISLEEIGRRAIEIRNWNNIRIKTKNKIADILNKDTVREIKKNHVSE
jgi:hypothetical protein